MNTEKEEIKGEKQRWIIMQDCHFSSFGNEVVIIFKKQKGRKNLGVWAKWKGKEERTCKLRNSFVRRELN